LVRMSGQGGNYHLVEDDCTNRCVEGDDDQVGELPRPHFKSTNVLSKDIQDSCSLAFRELPHAQMANIAIEPSLDCILNVLKVVVNMCVIVVSE